MAKTNRIEVTEEQMRSICAPCADKMKAENMRSFFLDPSKSDYGLPALDKETEAALRKFGEAAPAPAADGSRDIQGVEIFSSGTWNGEEYTDADLDQMVAAFQETAGALKPYLKLGHSEDQKLLAEDELPAAGWVVNLYRQGSKLLSDWTGVPAKIYELLAKRAYKRVSSEIFINLSVGGKVYPKALKAVALLGGETPAVQNLDDVLALGYSAAPVVLKYKTEAEVRTYVFDPANSKEDKMADAPTQKDHAFPPQHAGAPGGQPPTPGALPHPGAQPPLPGAAPMAAPGGPGDCMQRLAAAYMQMDEMNQKISGWTKSQRGYEEAAEVAKNTIAALTSERDTAKAKLEEVTIELKKFKTEARQKDVKAKIEKLVGEKKIVPAQTSALEAILLAQADGEVKKFKLGEKEFNSTEELVLEFIQNGQGAGLPTAPSTENGQANKTPDPKNGKEVHEAVLKYMAEKKVTSYKKAYTVVMNSLQAEEKARQAAAGDPPQGLTEPNTGEKKNGFYRTQ